MRIGVIINPVAGLGGAVGLKGTDGPGTVAEALRRGAVAQSGPRARRALAVLAQRCPGLAVMVAGGTGLDGLNLAVQTVDVPLTGTARDTKAAMASMGPLDLLVFAGGDGTARDVMGCLPTGTAMLGIPCGVKMHSGVFAVSPEMAGHLLADLVCHRTRIAWRDDAEVMDIDEAALRAGHIAPRLYGLARVPVARSLMQAAKGGPRRNAGAALAGAAQDIAARMLPGVLYVIGPGSSAGAVSRALGVQPTVLGVDAFREGRRVTRDATGAELARLAGDGPVQLVLGVTGQQGFLLGRGNQQIGVDLIRRAGREGLLVLATEEKLAALATPRLWVDTGDASLDAALAGFVRVQTDTARFMLMRIGPS